MRLICIVIGLAWSVLLAGCGENAATPVATVPIEASPVTTTTAATNAPTPTVIVPAPPGAVGTEDSGMTAALIGAALDSFKITAATNYKVKTSEGLDMLHIVGTIQNTDAIPLTRIRLTILAKNAVGQRIRARDEFLYQVVRMEPGQVLPFHVTYTMDDAPVGPLEVSIESNSFDPASNPRAATPLTGLSVERLTFKPGDGKSYGPSLTGYIVSQPGGSSTEQSLVGLITGYGADGALVDTTKSNALESWDKGRITAGFWRIDHPTVTTKVEIVQVVLR